MIFDIKHVANFLGLPATSNVTAFFNDSIKVRSLSLHQEWVEKNENLLTTLIGVLDDSGANALLPKEEIFQKALAANSQLMLVEDASVYTTLKAYSLTNNADSVFHEKVDADGTCRYGLVTGYSKKLPYARFQVFKWFKELGFHHNISHVTKGSNLSVLKMHPELIDLFVSHLYDLFGDKKNEEMIELMRRAYVLHIYQQAYTGGDFNGVYLYHTISLIDRYPEFRSINEIIIAVISHSFPKKALK